MAPKKKLKMLTREMSLSRKKANNIKVKTQNSNMKD